MLKPNTPATVEIVADVIRLLCQLQEQFNEIAVSHWALLNAINEKDSSMGDLYLEQKGIMEKRESMQSLALRLRQMKGLVAKLDADLA